MRKYGAPSRPSPTNPNSPKSARRKPKHHPLELYHLIPPPDPDTSDDNGDDESEPSAKRRKADVSPVASKNGARANPTLKRKRRSIDRDREISDSPNGRRASPSKKRKGGRDPAIDDDNNDSDNDSDSDNASSSNDGGYRAIPVNTSPPSFNSSSFKSGKRVLDYSPIEEPSDADEPQTFDFSSQSQGKNKNGKEAMSSRYVYDSASSSGEETSIPGTMPHSSQARPGTQKVPGREPSEMRETEKAVAESLDQGSDENLGERSFNAVRSSQVEASKPAESPGSGDSEYESAEDGSKYLPSHVGSGQAPEAPSAETEETGESEDEQSSSNESGAEPTEPRPHSSKAPDAGADESSAHSSAGQSSGSDSEEGSARASTSEAAEARKEAETGAERSSNGSAGAQSSRSDSGDETPSPRPSKAATARAPGSSRRGDSKQSDDPDSDLNVEPTRKAAKAAKAAPTKNRSTSASRTVQPRANGNASAKKTSPANSQPTPRGKKLPATPASASQPSSKSQTSVRQNGRPRSSPSSATKDTPEVLGRLTSREEQMLNSAIEKFLAINKFTDDDLPSLVKGEIEDTAEAQRLHERFWADIYESLPHRTSRYLRAIVKRKHISYSKKKKWSTEEDERLVELAKEHDGEDKKWLHIGNILGRTATECRDRHRNYALCGSARTIGPWKPDELRLLLKEVSKSVPEDVAVGDRPYHALHYAVDWIEVSRGMGGRRSRQQCLAKWTSMRVNVNNLRVRRLLHGRQKEVSPELRIVLMQVYSTPEESLKMLVGAIATHVAERDKGISWRELGEGELTKEMRVETLNIIWSRLRRGLAKGMRNKSDQECARKMYESIEEKDLEKVVAEQEDIEAEEGIMSDPPRTLSTRASFMVGRG